MAHQVCIVRKLSLGWTQVNSPTDFYFAPNVIYGRVNTPLLEDETEVPFSVFVAYPLLPTGPDGGRLQKYTGSDSVGEQPTDPLGLLIHSFAHFSLYYSCGTLVFTDLQGLRDKMGRMCLFDVQAHTYVFVVWLCDLTKLTAMPGTNMGVMSISTRG